MKKIYLILTCFVLAVLTACQDDDFGNNVTVQKGESLFTFSLPEPVTATRANMGEATLQTIDNLHILVFNEKGFFLANATATISNPSATGGTCTAKLPVSNRKCRLHFIANYNDYQTYTSTDTENSIVGSMTTTNNQDAYWGMVEVENIPDTGLKLEAPVELVRNFAKITLSSEASGLTVQSYTVYNQATAGLVAPYDPQDGTFADFTKVADTNPYESFMGLYPDYQATTKGDIRVNELDPENQWKTTDEPYYVYERNQDNSDIPAALIVKAHYSGGNGTEGDYYYKLDIVQFMQGTFETVTYNLLRNFEYHITINQVKSAGYATAEDAMNAAASNNLAASVQVSKVRRITDGEHTLEVSTIDTLIVEQKELVLTYRYWEGETDCTNTNEVKVLYDLNEKIFSSIDIATPGFIKLTPKALPNVLENQEIVVTTKSGLSRHITVRVHQPFEFVAIDCQRKVEAKQKAEFVLIMELPMGLPTAAFPLNLSIDMKGNTLYPNSSKNHLPVNITDPKNYTYDLVVDYNSYRQNRTQYCHFLTNTAASATDIQVSGVYFKPTEAVSFENTTPLSFTNIYFNNQPVNGSNQLTVPYGAGEAAQLRFDMYDASPVTIYVRYLENPTSNTGTIEEVHNSEGSLNGYKYTPHATGTQRINFVSKGYIAAETIELSSDNYAPALISYTNPWVNVQFTTPKGIVPDGKIVKVYEDAYYQGFIADLTPVVGGKTVMRSFAGYQPESILYFLYQDGNVNYRGEMSVSDLTSKGGGEDKLVTVELKQK